MTPKDKERIFAKLSPLDPSKPEFRRAKMKFAIEFEFAARGFDYAYERIIEEHVSDADKVRILALGDVEMSVAEYRRGMAGLIIECGFASQKHFESYASKLRLEAGSRVA